MTDLPQRHEPPKKNGLTDYGPKTAAAIDHPYGFDESPPPPVTERTPQGAHTDINSEADLGDPSQTG